MTIPELAENFVQEYIDNDEAIPELALWDFCLDHPEHSRYELEQEIHKIAKKHGVKIIKKKSC